MLLNRVLSDKGKLPEACRAPSARAVQNVSEQSTPAKAKPDESSGFEGIVRRLTGAIPGAFTSVSDADDCKKGEVGLAEHTPVSPGSFGVFASSYGMPRICVERLYYLHDQP